MLDFLKENKGLIINCIAVIIILIVLIAFVYAIFSVLANENNKISDGKVIDKSYQSGGTNINSSHDDFSVRSTPPQYYILIEGNKDGKTVEYWCEVTAAEYDSVKIGDWFKR